MSQFQEPDVIATFDRSFGDKKEELRLERGEYQGSPTFTLRLHWLSHDGKWRWASQKPTQSGKCWERLNIKQRELKALGEALIRAAEDSTVLARTPDFRATTLRKQPVFAPKEVNDDDIPF